MSSSLKLVCPHCNTTNRVPTQRLGDGPTCGKCHESLFTGQPLSLNQGSFSKHVNNSDIPLVVDFWAPWCGPCQMMAPAFESAAQALEPRARLAKVDTEQEPGIGTQFQIRSIPTLICFKGGKEIARQAGAMRAPDIIKWVESVLPQ